MEGFSRARKVEVQERLRRSQQLLQSSWPRLQRAVAMEAMQAPTVCSPAMLVHGHRSLRLEVMALRWMLVTLLAATRAPRRESEDTLPTSPTEFVALQEELNVAQEEMQAMQEELAVTQEELYALHEELLATQEELRATAAELEATTAELATLNGELQRQSDKEARHARATMRCWTSQPRA